MAFGVGKMAQAGNPAAKKWVENVQSKFAAKRALSGNKNIEAVNAAGASKAVNQRRSLLGR